MTISPEAQDGGPIAYLRTGDIVTVDQDTKEISMAVSEEELEKRKAETTLPPLYSRGVLGKYAHIVSSASRGAVTDFWNHFRPKTCPELPDQGARAWSADVTAQFNMPRIGKRR